MFFWTLSVIVSWLLDIFAIAGLADSEKDLELPILRHQINILKRQVKHPRVSRLEKLSLAMTVNKLRKRAGRSRQQLTRTVLIFKPETVLGWQRELVRRKWTFKQRRQPGRPRTDPEIEALIVRLARENPPCRPEIASQRENSLLTLELLTVPRMIETAMHPTSSHLVLDEQ